jgi:hypothetical protein
LVEYPPEQRNIEDIVHQYQYVDLTKYLSRAESHVKLTNKNLNLGRHLNFHKILPGRVA